jgi:hypothetical protein
VLQKLDRIVDSLVSKTKSFFPVVELKGCRTYNYNYYYITSTQYTFVDPLLSVRGGR